MAVEPPKSAFGHIPTEDRINLKRRLSSKESGRWSLRTSRRPPARCPAQRARPLGLCKEGRAGAGVWNDVRPPGLRALPGPAARTLVVGKETSVELGVRPPCLPNRETVRQVAARLTEPPPAPCQCLGERHITRSQGEDLAPRSALPTVVADTCRLIRPALPRRDPAARPTSNARAETDSNDLKRLEE
jgi:hypothetical protein